MNLRGFENDSNGPLGKILPKQNSEGGHSIFPHNRSIFSQDGGQVPMIGAIIG